MTRRHLYRGVLGGFAIINRIVASVGDALLMETGDYLLLESGDKILIE
jgi:hypothetical protein